MKKSKLYYYFGANGTLLTPVNIPGAQGVIKYRLEPEDGYLLTKDGKNTCENIVVPEDEVENWKEIKKGQ